MDKFLKASLFETKRIPANLTTGSLRVDYEHGLVYPVVDGMKEEEILSVFNVVFPNLKEFQNTFHKSWEKIEDTDQLDLWTEAIIHYFTTYGLESLGIDNEGFVYIPDEVDLTPELRKFRVIATVSVDELEQMVRDNLASGVALKQSTIENYLTILDYYGIDLLSLIVNNKEVRTKIQYKAGIVPQDGTELVRVLTYALTGKTTLIKNKDTFYHIANLYNVSDNKNYIERLLTVGKERCASVFYRNKVIFLALRKIGFKKEVNKIRRLAKYYWYPKPEKKFLSTMILGDEKVGLEDLEKLSIYDLVKIYNKLNYTIKSTDKLGCYYDMMVIRNGSIYIKQTPKNLTPQQYAWAVNARETILKLVQHRLDPKEEKQIILPDNLDLAFPTSEKSFIADIPLYSRAICPESSVVGIAWKKEDLDLSALLEDGGKVGWNSHYSDATKDVMYSGDCTRGGAEALYFNANHAALIMMNLYYGDIPEVNLFISNEKEFNLGEQDNNGWGSRKKYIFDPNNIIYSTKLAVDGESKVLGLYDKQDNQTVFTFVDMKLGSSNVSRNSELTKIAIEVLRLRGESALKLQDVYSPIRPEDFEENIETILAVTEGNEEEAEKYRETVTDLRSLDKSVILGLSNDLPKDK